MKFIKILGIKFLDGEYDTVRKYLNKNLFMVVPAAPGLAEIDKNSNYYNAIRNSDFAIPDSGFMVLLYLFFYKKKIKKLSGAKFLRIFINEKILKSKNKLFLIDPSEYESNLNKIYLNKIGIPIRKKYQYIAPIYHNKNIDDKRLCNYLNSLKDKPSFIMINLGGGVQEILGFYLKKNLNFKCSIICTGAAIAFLTGAQSKMPIFIDKIYMGWFYRIIKNPKIFLLRYIKAFRLVKIFKNYKKGLIN